MRYFGDLQRGTDAGSPGMYCWEISGEVLMRDLRRGTVKGFPESYSWRSLERYCWGISADVLLGISREVLMRDTRRGTVRGSPERYCSGIFGEVLLRGRDSRW